MRRRVYDVLRRAVASEDTRTALGRGALVEEPEVAGFAALSSVATPTSPRPRSERSTARDKRRNEERRKRVQTLRQELARAERVLAEAERSAAAAEREQARAERAVASIRAKLDRLS